jgi:hypothetical protein
VETFESSVMASRGSIPAYSQGMLSCCTKPISMWPAQSRLLCIVYARRFCAIPHNSLDLFSVWIGLGLFKETPKGCELGLDRDVWAVVMQWFWQQCRDPLAGISGMPASALTRCL